jgi:carboxymethylenebutenolidase
MEDIQAEDEVPLPSAKSVILGPGITLQPPLSRLGHGPGLIILIPTTSPSTTASSDYLAPLQKWAEEGFAVVEIKVTTVHPNGSHEESLEVALDALAKCPTCDGDMVGLIGKPTCVD